MPSHRKERERTGRAALLLARSLRSLVVTPWFAAGAGLMIAAAVAIGSPPALTYGPAVPELRCSAGGCTGLAQGHRPGLAAAGPGVALQDGGGAASAGRRPGAPAVGVPYERVEYQIITDGLPGFVVVITLPGGLKPGSWHLQFGFPAARIDRVWGARWQPSGNGQAGTATGRGHRLTVWADGAPAAPSGCRLDGVRCGFSRRAGA
jgi:hypothetical protein